MIRVFEVTHSHVHGPTGDLETYLPTGRQMLMAADSPLFKNFGDRGQRAIEEGALALDKPMYQQVLEIVEAFGGAEAMPNADSAVPTIKRKKGQRHPTTAQPNPPQRQPVKRAVEEDEDDSSGLEVLGLENLIEGNADDSGSINSGNQRDTEVTQAFDGFDGGGSGGGGVTGDYGDNKVDDSDATGFNNDSGGDDSGAGGDDGAE